MASVLLCTKVIAILGILGWILCPLPPRLLVVAILLLIIILYATAKLLALLLPWSPWALIALLALILALRFAWTAALQRHDILVAAGIGSARRPCDRRKIMALPRRAACCTGVAVLDVPSVRPAVVAVFEGSERVFLIVLLLLAAVVAPIGRVVPIQIVVIIFLVVLRSAQCPEMSQS